MCHLQRGCRLSVELWSYIPQEVYYAVEEEDLSFMSCPCCDLTRCILGYEVFQQTMSVASLTKQLAKAIAKEIQNTTNAVQQNTNTAVQQNIAVQQNGVHFALPDDWRIETMQRQNGKKYRVYYSPTGERFRSVKRIKEHLESESSGLPSSGLPIGWKRVKSDNSISFTGPEGVVFDHMYQVLSLIHISEPTRLLDI